MDFSTHKGRAIDEELVLRAGELKKTTNHITIKCASSFTAQLRGEAPSNRYKDLAGARNWQETAADGMRLQRHRFLHRS